MNEAGAPDVTRMTRFRAKSLMSDSITAIPTASHSNQLPGRYWSWGASCLRRALYGIVFIGVIARLAGDQAPLLSTAFYALPLPVLAGSTLLLTVMNFRQRARAIRWGVCSALILIGIYTEDWRHQPDRSQTNDLKVVFWNACRLHRGWDQVTAEVRSWDADIVALVEAGTLPREELRQKWMDGCPGYKVSILGAGIVLLTRGEAGQSTVHEFDRGSRAREIMTTVRGQSLKLVIVDIQANPFYSRNQPLQQLAKVTDTLSRESTVIVGDFNTPADSLLLEPLKSNYTMAFDQAGQGYRATWPIPLPVLSLDQAWTSAQVEVTSCQHLWTRASDHRPVALTVRGEAATPLVVRSMPPGRPPVQ